jgi:hypothetical protein
MFYTKFQLLRNCTGSFCRIVCLLVGIFHSFTRSLRRGRALDGGHYQKQAHAQLQVGPKTCDVELLGGIGLSKEWKMCFPHVVTVKDSEFSTEGNLGPQWTSTHQGTHTSQFRVMNLNWVNNWYHLPSILHVSSQLHWWVVLWFTLGLKNLEEIQPLLWYCTI